MNRFIRFAALRWMYNVIVPPRYRDKLNITEELCAFESALNKVIEVTNANGKALEAISQDLEDIQFGAGGYYRPAITDNEDGSVTFSFVASDDSMPPIEEKTFFLGDMQTITEMLQGFDEDPMAVKKYIDEKSGGYYTPVFEQSGNTVTVSFTASNEMLPALDGYSFTLPAGPSGKSAYDSYLDNGGTMTEKAWVDSLKGKDGESFYQMCVKNGFVGSETDLIIAMKGDPYELTETDITTIVQKVVENLGGQPVAGYFDENNDIVLTSTLPDGTYTFKIETDDGVYELGTLTKKTIINVYTVTFVADGVTVAEVEYEEGATSLDSVPDVPTKDGYTGEWESYTLNNTNITVDAVYTENAPAVTTYGVTLNGTNCTSDGASSVNEGAAYSAKLTPSNGKNMIYTASVKMGGADITSSAYNSTTNTVNIANVTGNVEITARAIKNLLPLAVDVNGNDYVGSHANGGDGWEYGIRVNSAGAEVVLDGLYCTGFMPCALSSKIRIKNVSEYTTDPSRNRIQFYNSSKTNTNGTTLLQANTVMAYKDGVYTLTPSAFVSTANFFRFACGSITSATIVTVDEEL